MIYILEILKSSLDERLLIKYYKVKHLILLKIQSTMDINMNLLQWFINFLIKSQINRNELAEELDKPILQ